MFGHGIEVIHDGPYPAPLLALTGDAKARAVDMLRRGIQACEVYAVQAIERAQWRNLVPDLTKAATAG